ncbi:MAG: hypothetical protein ACYCWW_15515 [Deltaproteobacteria bacterium]
MPISRPAIPLAALLALLACGHPPASRDAGAADSGLEDAGAGRDGGALDAGADGGPFDAGFDAGAPDSGADDAGSADAGAVDGGFSPATHDPFPTLTDHGGLILTTPTLVTVTYQGHPNASDIDRFTAWLPGSSWLAAVGADYGVTGATLGPSVLLDGGPPPIAGSGDVAALLMAGFDAGTLPSPQGLVEPVYLVFFPPDAGIAGVCSQVFAYHAAGLYDGEPFAFVADPDCPESATGYPELEEIELTASHELIEAATNPYSTIDGGVAFQLTDSSSPWWQPGGGENADLCEGAVYFDADAGFYAQRSWSLRAAAAGEGSPCVPAPADYFNVSPTPNAVVTLDGGSSVTFYLTGWSAAPEPPWGVAVMAEFGDFDPTPSLPTTQLDNGGDGGVTLTVPVGTPSGQRAVVWIGSYAQGSSDWTSYWPVAVEAR